MNSEFFETIALCAVSGIVSVSYFTALLQF